MPKTLLLADDSVVIQKLVGLSFANEDVSIITADNGDDAISLAAETRPDVVIADVVMPGKSGYEVCAALQASPELSHIPVLLLTGTFEAFDEERSRAVGSAGHITKPFEAQALVKRVTELLDRAASATPTTIPTASAGDLEVTEENLATGDDFDFFDEDISDLSTENTFIDADDLSETSTDLDKPFATSAPDALDPNEDLLMLGDDDAVSLDPGGSAFDISSSDLGDLNVASNETAAPVASEDAFDLPPSFETLESEPTLDGLAASSFDDLLEVPALAPASSAPAAPTFAPNVPEVAAAEFDVPARPAAGVDMTPMLQERLHETLEKVAWEAFSEISEQVVKQVLERVESIAWEVIPEMTEALVQEEIRKMKGEDESSE